MSSTAVWTVGRLLQWTTDYLKQHGADSPRLDAEVLLAEVLHCPRIELYTRFEEKPDETARAAFRTLVQRRARGEPVAYLVGHREFYSLSFRVTPEVLIPRPETELLVVAVLDYARNLGEESVAGRELRIADVGTGSGAIAVCLAKHLPRCRVTATDISLAALAVARENALAHRVAERIEFFEGDLLAAVPPEQRFDFVVSNPPYVSTAEWSQLPSEVREHEPQVALLAGPEGTEVIERLIPQAAERLRSGGWLLLEVSPMLHEAVLGLIASDGRFEPGPTIKDFARQPRVVQARRH